MKIIQKNELCDFFHIDEKITIVDNIKFKYYSTNTDPLLETISTFFSNGGRIIDYKITDIAYFFFFFQKQVTSAIKQLIRLDILNEIEVKTDESAKYGINNKLFEIELDERFGSELLWLKQFTRRPMESLEKLHNLRILIIGAGGLGSSLAVELSAMGVKNISVIDGDIVELDNLTRQIFYTVEQVKNKTLKVDALGNYIKSFYPETKYKSFAHFINSYEELLNLQTGNIDLIIQTADYPRGKIDEWVNEVAISKNIPTIFCHHKTVGPFFIPKHTNCLKCFENELDKKMGGLFYKYKNLAQNQPNSKAPSYVGNLLFSEGIILDMIVKYFLLNDVEYYKNKIYRFDTLGIGFESFSFDQSANCTHRREE